MANSFKRLPGVPNHESPFRCAQHRGDLQRNLEALAPHTDAGTPMVGLEPSCCSVFRDEMHNLFPDSAQARRLAENTFTLSEFLEKRLPTYQPPRWNRKAIVHGHCHHKAILRFTEEKTLMKKIGLDHELLESGCCGILASFGYERGKYEVSVACGERSLLPAVRNAGVATIIMANGFSCKEQLAQETNRHGLTLLRCWKWRFMQINRIRHTRSPNGNLSNFEKRLRSVRWYRQESS